MTTPIAKKTTNPFSFKSIVDTGKKAVMAGLSVKKAVTDGFEAAKNVGTQGLRGAYNTGVAKAAEAASNPTGKLNLLGKLKIAGGAIGAVTGLATLPGKVGTAIKDIRQAVRSGSMSDIATAAQSGIAAAKGAVSTAKSALTTAVTVNKLTSTYKAASTAFQAAVPGASKAVTSAAARAAMSSTFEGLTKGAVKGAATEAALAAAKKGGTIASAVTGSAGRAAAKAALKEGGKAAGEAALKAGAKAAAGGLGKAAARFAPGLNIAIAALDTANAVATVMDPKASTGKKVTSVITAIGSIAAATNIPIVSQVGAAVSAVSGFIGSFF
jgi:hypothetical protein